MSKADWKSKFAERIVQNVLTALGGKGSRRDAD